MASTLKDEAERNRRVLLIAQYVKQTHASTRETAAYFSENFFSISNATVNDYLNNRLMKLNEPLYFEIKEIIKENTPKTVEDKNVQKRVLKASKLLLKGLTIEEIATLLHETKDTIYRDVTARLPQINEGLSTLVEEELKKHSLDNLIQNKEK